MTDKRSLKLVVAGIRDFATPSVALCVLALVAAIVSPRPVLVTILFGLICAAGWGAYILGLFKLNDENSCLIVFPDGRIRLESGNRDTSGGVLSGQQWSTRHFAILRVELADGVRYLPIRSDQQRQADEFRRLLMWLRQDFCRGAKQKRAPSI